ncbi:site-specific DNA-methyltransferase [Paraburkholderia sp. DGU8]|uniref:site-specific DNA-methyltransferase n=1 Tax=Paraburkholderia sp. DGU8 TaxID=3161997 RepID=UPI003467B7CF
MTYESLSTEELIEILKRRDDTASYGLVWERQGIEQDKKVNRDFVGLTTESNLSVGPADGGNFIIEGDNFDSLRALATTHSGAFHLIYCDVPYNTGTKDFVYNDHFFDKNNRYRHSTWLEFIYQRMLLIKQLLREDGAVVVSIDDNELFNLGLLMNQVFGEDKRVATCIWQKRYSRENREAIGDAHEYLLVYSLNPSKFKTRRGLIRLSGKQAAVYKNPENPDETDPTKRWRSIPMTAQGTRPNQMYTVVSPSGKKHKPKSGRCWSLLEDEFLELDKANKIWWGKNKSSQPGLIRYLSEVDGIVPWTWWPHDEVGHTDESRKEIEAFFGTQTAFDTPKPVRLMERLIQICAPEKDALVLDPFAGSGTTAQAVLQANKIDHGMRRFVLLSSSESTDENPDKNLCREVCAVRVRKVIEGYDKSVRKKTGPATVRMEGTGGGFRYLQAHRIPMHRLEEALTDDMVWNFALMACGHELTPLSHPFSISVRPSDQHMVVYCATTKQHTLIDLAKAVEAHAGKVAILSWAPEIVEEALGGLADRVSLVHVPDDLKRVFKQGNVRASNTEGAES